MRHIFSVILIISFFATGCAAHSGENPWNNKRIYYVIEFQGQMIERGFFIRRVGSFQKMDCWVIDEEKEFFSGGNTQQPTRTMRTRTLTTFEGLALQRSETSAGFADGHENISIINGEARFDASGAYGFSDVVAVPEAVLFEVSGEWLASLQLRRGNAYTADVLDRATRGVVTTDVLIVDREMRAAAGNPAVWLAEITTPGRPPVEARFTEDGRLMRLEGSGMTYQVVGRGAYDIGRIPAATVPQAPQNEGLDTGDFRDEPIHDTGLADSGRERQPALYSSAGTVNLPIGASVPAWDSFAWLLLQAEPGYDWANALTNSEYALVEATGMSTMVTALRYAPFLDSKVNFPMIIPADVQPYLNSTDILPSGHKAVIEAAYVAVVDSETNREETNVLRAVSYLAGWINQSVAVEDWKGYESTALETLAQRSSDSLGHARLFAAMARTLGVPTRVCQGFLATMGTAVNHCWAEAWINGGWVPVDTTVSRVGLPAGYVLAERSDGSGAFKYDFVSFMRSPGLGLRLISAGRKTPRGARAELLVSDRRTYAVSEGDWMANLYWGFALRLPRSWNGRATMNTVEVISGDRQASVKCEALEGDFEARKEELDSTIASLQSNLDRFKTIESRVVAFDGEGATPALYIDFSCTQNGTVLRCRQYVIPRRHRAFRISFWAPSNRFSEYTAEFDRVLASFEF